MKYMGEIVGVRFKETGRIYYFDPSHFDLEVGEYVVVPTARGLEVGRVVIAPYQVLAHEFSEPLKPVVRRADDEDLRHRDQWRSRAKEALELARGKASELKLSMSLIEAEYSQDGKSLNLDFTADERVNFRELHKALSEELGVRVHLRQIGPRDRAKLAGGMGVCGRALCCATWLSQLPAIGIKMAKEQDLAPNPEKISGLCGRLRCCLAYENETYRQLQANLPKKGQTVLSNAGPGRLVGANVIKQTVFLELESWVTVEVALQELIKEVQAMPDLSSEEAAFEELAEEVEETPELPPSETPSLAKEAEASAKAPSRRRCRRRRSSNSHDSQGN